MKRLRAPYYFMIDDWYKARVEMFRVRLEGEHPEARLPVRHTDDIFRGRITETTSLHPYIFTPPVCLEVHPKPMGMPGHAGDAFVYELGLCRVCAVLADNIPVLAQHPLECEVVTILDVIFSEFK